MLNIKYSTLKNNFAGKTGTSCQRDFSLGPLLKNLNLLLKSERRASAGLHTEPCPLIRWYRHVRDAQVEVEVSNIVFCLFIFYFLHEPQSLTMHYIRDERGDEALMLCRPMGLGFSAARARQEGKENRYEKQ